MGDSAECLVLSLPEDATVSDVLLAILQAGFLPGVGGGGATWLVMGLKPVAVVAEKWTAPRWLMSPDLPVSATREPSGQYDYWFDYGGHRDPEQMYDDYRDSGR